MQNPTLEQLMIEVRLNSKEDSCGCWIWGGRTQRGRPVININRSDITVHRAIELLRGMKRHLVTIMGCETQMCVNPDHIKRITYSESRRRSAMIFQQLPKYERSRMVAGGQKHRRLFTDDIIIEIRNSSIYNKEWAKKLNCSEETISRIRNYETYKEVGANIFTSLIRGTI